MSCHTEPNEFTQPVSGELQVDVAIVGAGPAGSATALGLLLQRPSLRVVLIDRAAFPRVKPCGGAISQLGLDILERLDVKLSTLGVPFLPIESIRLTSAKSCGTTTSPRPLGALVRRDAFDLALSTAAVRRGATLLQPWQVVELGRTVGRPFLRVRHANGTDHLQIVCRHVIGADGTGSFIRRALGLGEQRRRAQVIVTETNPGAFEQLQHNGQATLEFRLEPMGYTWNFATPHPQAAFGESLQAVSRGVFSQTDVVKPQRLRAELASQIIASGSEQITHLQPYSERVFAVTRLAPLLRLMQLRSPFPLFPLHPSPLPITTLVGQDDILLVGEALGLVDPITGEGIAQALASGFILAESGLDRSKYAQALEAARWYQHLTKSAHLEPIVYGPLGRHLGSLLARSPKAMATAANWYAGRPTGSWNKLQAVCSMGSHALSMCWMSARNHMRRQRS